MPYLVEIGGAQSRRHELSAAVTIGRDPANTICFADPLVSGRHAEVRCEAGRWRIIDLGSRRGTFVASRKVSEAVLADGDEILIGPARLRFEEAPPPRPQRRDDDVDKLRAVTALVRAIGVEHDLTTLSQGILDTAFELMAAERGAIVLVDPSNGRTLAQVSRGRGGQAVDLPLSTSLVSQAMSSKAGVITADTCLDDRFDRSQSIDVQGIRSAMCVPLVYQDEILGVMQLDSSAAVNVFSERDLELFSAITSQAAMAVKNALLVARVQGAAADEWRRVERVVRCMPAGVLLLDAEHRIALANGGADAILPVLGPARRGDVLETLGPFALDALLAQRGKGSVDVAVDGKGAPTRVFAISAAESDGETIVVLQEVTEERMHEARAGHQDRLALIGQLAGGVAHDFNNLLMVILNYAAFVEAEVVDFQLRDDVHQIAEAAQRASDITRQLLSFSRRELLAPRVLRLDVLIDEMQKLLARALGEPHTLEVSHGANLPRIKADPTKIEQVLMNLTVNARDAMSERGTLRVSTAAVAMDGAQAQAEGLPPGRYAEITVADDGVGMAPEVVARVFEPFFTTKETGKGTGLGLATVYGVVKQTDGSVSVTSTVGVGTRFRILLPETHEPLRTPGESAAELAGGKETVLVVEDEPAVRTLCGRILRQAGYRVVEADHGPAALALAARHEGEIQLLLTDLMMPGMSGKQLADELMLARPRLQVLFMSGFFDERVGAPGRMFLPKPFTREELLRRVRGVLGR